MLQNLVSNSAKSDVPLQLAWRRDGRRLAIVIVGVAVILMCGVARRR
ncbi:MAG: hypothetical protein ACK4S2_15305 [Gemmobacter sp.]